MGTGIETYMLIIVILCASLILVFMDAILTIISNNKEYKKSSFRLLTNYNLKQVMFNKKISKQYELFEKLERTCLNGHMLCNVKIKDENGYVCKYDLVMIDKYGISVFDICDEEGTISGNYTMPFWKLKKGLITYKIPNYSLIMNRKLELLKDTLKITASDIINCYIVFNDKTKFKGLRLDNKNIKLLKLKYVNGALAYETNNINRVISDTEIVSYTVLLEKHTDLPLYLRNDQMVLKEDEDDEVNTKKMFSFEFHKQLSNYEDLKQLWNVVCKCDKDVYPPLALRRKDVEDIPDFAKEMLLPNIYYKEIIHHPLLLVRRGKTIIGFLSFEPNKILKLSEELGRINLLDNACVLKEYRKEGLISDLYDFAEYKIPEEYILPYMLIKSSSKNDSLNRIIKEKGYKEKIIVDTKRQYGADTIYYFKKIKSNK